MDVINKSVIASVEILEVKLSEDEIGVYEAALGYLLDTLSSEELESRFGATRDELEGMRDDLRQALTGDSVAADESDPVLTSKF
ncbi:MAG TPA: hypothetical protein VJ842_04825 [Pyrinomonadaceae bacterium]|nr:hypothetical protein [Pyrinomonadaceae bacterium]